MRLPWVAVVALGTVAPCAPAGIITYTDRTAFLAAVAAGYYEEAFTGLAEGPLPSPQAFAGGGFSYSVSASASTLWSTTIGGDRFLGLADGGTTTVLTLSSFGGSPTAVGGYFFFDNDAGAIQATSFGTLTATNGVDTVAVGVTAPTSTTGFFGFISTSGALTSLSFVRDGGEIGWADVDDVIVGLADVPEPSTVSLTVLGLAAGFWLRRRR